MNEAVVKTIAGSVQISKNLKMIRASFSMSLIDVGGTGCGEWRPPDLEQLRGLTRTRSRAKREEAFVTNGKY